MAVGAVVARILTQYSDKGSKQAQKDIAKLGRRIDDYAKKATRAFGLVAFASAAAAVKIGKDSVMAASDISQQFGALDAVFQGNSKELKDFSKTMVEFGLSAADSARYSALLGTQLTGLGLTETDAINKTKELQILAADLAATFGGTTADAVAAFGSVLKGEYNPIERYGVAIRKSDITARVAAKGLKGLTGEALKAAEAQSALELIFLKTTAAQGQAMREYNSLAAQLQRLDASYMNIKATIGLALLPVVERFTNYLLKELIPAIEKFAEVNKKEIAKALEDTSNLFKMLIENSGNLTKVLGVLVSISTFLNTSILGVIKWGEALLGIFLLGKTIGLLNKLVGGLGKEVLFTGKRFDVAFKNAGKFGAVLKKIGPNARIAAIGIGLINTAFIALRTTAIGAAIATAFATAGVSVGTAALALAAVGITAVSVKALMGDYTKETVKAGAATVDLSKQIYGGAAAEKYKAEVEAKNAKARAAAAAAEKKAAAAAAAQAKKDAALKAAIAKGQAALEKFGIKTKEDDPIQLEAARLNLVKQGNLAEAARIAVMTKNLELQLEANKALSRYNDLLAVLADKEISSEEIFLLSKKWGMTIEAAQSYIQTLLAVSDQTISDDEITNLAKSWGVSKDQASRYLDFFTALNDGKLSDAEIAKLQTKWGLTSKEVQIYADLITKASDYVLSDEEITALGTNWGLTTKEVVEYIKKLGQPVTFSGTLIDPATQATLGWKNALAALLAYQAALGNKGITTTVVPPTATTPPVVSVTPKVDGLGGSKTDSAATKAAESAASAIAYAVAKATGDETKAAIAAAGVTPSALASQESGAIGAASIAAQLRAAEEAVRISSSLAAFKAKEAADLAASQANARTMDYDERFRFMGSSTMDNAKSLVASGSSTAAPVINLTVNGSVTTENDLVQTIRTGLLAAQQNGQGLTLQAI
jgi:hypothetical protein